jgi:dTDP-4-dehydrorhamnose reductase
MKLLVTGLNGTLAPILARTAERLGFSVVGWDRNRTSTDEGSAGDAWLESERPDAIAHLAMGSPEWARRLALYAAIHAKPLIFTSSAMVFHHQPDGPHGIHAERNAQDDYGRYKRDCEDAILTANPSACVARIGWQIDPSQPGNNMLMALDQWQTTTGRISASRAWRPACSFMEDTAAALMKLLQNPVHGVSHIDSNADEGHDFVQIALSLRIEFGRESWRVHPNADYRHDQRLLGGGALVPPLSDRLVSLKCAADGDA